ncbi:MAG TPA: hypothetical protein PK156_15730, partial [Polyangium sp.]|nr:hypothetical protein [Polyangium sp.]
MATRRFSRNSHQSLVPPLASDPIVQKSSHVFERQTNVLPNEASNWLDSLPIGWRRHSVSCIDALADQLAYGQARDPHQRSNVFGAVEFVSTLARTCLGGEASPEFVQVIMQEPRLIELGLLMAMSQLSLAQRIPRGQGFYPAVIFEREVLRVVRYTAERDQPATALLWYLIALRQPSLVDEIQQSLSNVQCGFAKNAQWPSRDVAMQLGTSLQRMTNLWVSLAQDLIAATDTAGGKLLMIAVENAAKPFLVGRPECKLLLGSINRPRQKQQPRDLLVTATQWPQRAVRILDNLSGDYGSLRLYSAYMRAVWSAVLAGARQFRGDERMFRSRYSEIVARDIAYPIFAGIEKI